MHKFKVLIADDETVISESLGAASRERDHETLTAFDGLSALSTAEKEAPDALMLKWRMPDLDGLQM